jgi:tRNA pseudouridine38-40 synthase
LKYRYFIHISYFGFRYVGWQFQPNGLSIQELLEKGVATLLKESVRITGAGRTDAGVHARFFVAHFDLNFDLQDLHQIVYKLNRILPEDIAVQQLYRVNGEAHARFSALNRTYEYHISTVKNPFLKGMAWYYAANLDLEKMNEAATILYGYSDFTSFSKLHTDVRTNLCRILMARWTLLEDKLLFTIMADRFLRNMVRAIAGTMIEVGSGKVSLDRFREIIELRDRSLAGFSVPAEGLFLTGISYPDWIYRIDP